MSVFESMYIKTSFGECMCLPALSRFYPAKSRTEPAKFTQNERLSSTPALARQVYLGHLLFTTRMTQEIGLVLNWILDFFFHDTFQMFEKKKNLDKSTIDCING